MGRIKEDLKNTSLPTLVINRSDFYSKYPQIGFGCESSVHKYDDKTAFKIFDFFPVEVITRKFEKIEALGKIRDEAACFPIGLVGYEDLKKEGYFCDLVDCDEETKDFEQLRFLKDARKGLEYIIKAEEAIKRFHNIGFIVGDIKGDNIMIDKDGNIKFVDTDNWRYQDFDFDLEPDRSKWLKTAFHKDCSLIDNDKYVYALLALQYLIDISIVNGSIISYHQNNRYFDDLISLLKIPKEAKNALRLILSDAPNKPYISDILREIDVEDIIEKDDINKLRKRSIYY